MVTRLSASDASFFHLENSSTPMYVGSLSILRKPRNGLSYETLLETVEQRLPQIPRYRQKVREVTFGLARPVWIDDRDFDITYHIRRSALPSPGSDAQLHELVARLGSRAAGQDAAAVGDVSRRGAGQEPAGDLHQVAPGAGQRDDGARDRPRHRRPHAEAAGVRRGHLDPGARARRCPAAGRAPSASGSPGRERSWPPCARAVIDVATNSGQLVDVGRRFADVARTVARGTAPSSPLNTKVSRNRRFTVASATAGGLPQAAGPLRLRRQRRRAGGDRGRAAQLAAVARRAGDADADRAGDGADVGVPGRRAGPTRARARRSARCRRSWSTCRSARATRWCGCPRSRTPPSRIRRRPAWSTPAPSSRCRVSRHRPCTPWEFGWRRRSRPGSSTC